MPIKEAPLHAVVLGMLIASGCSNDRSAAARKAADDFVRTEYSLDLRNVKVEVREEKKTWVVTYSAKGEALGGPLVVGVNKRTI